ncbi:MAG: alpha-L-rhamnosidase N-terminal domain-containing protein [Saprospiraceae bacterium]|nr:alpha-L-rhamnosidase N-terminal domain-containing protein [Saprospiraceae bacterium]
MVWRRSRLDQNTNIYGSELSAIAQIMLTLKDGSTMILATDDSWTYSTGPILFSEIYHGNDTMQEKKMIVGLLREIQQVVGSR